MSDEDTEDDSADTLDERVTAPMQAFGSREVSIGILVLAVGLLITFILPFVF